MSGHCISVDPYYLAHKANALGYHPQVILSGRRVNNSIANFIAQKTMKLMIQADHKIKNANILLLGITFKEDCPDMRNSKVIDIYKELKDFGVNVDVYDPWADAEEVKEEYGIELLPKVNKGKHYQAVIAAVSHKEFYDFDFAHFKENGAVIFDVKNFVPRDVVDARL